MPNQVKENKSIHKNLKKLTRRPSVRQWPGRLGFTPSSSHIKDFKNGT